MTICTKCHSGMTRADMSEPGWSKTLAFVKAHAGHNPTWAKAYLRSMCRDYYELSPEDQQTVVKLVLQLGYEPRVWNRDKPEGAP